ncbi:DUF5954 family protein [Streptomyces sp. NPDC048057]|uniref:DUF5954 family protein n=1 Tax=Streptomyces sp. NPDC048057 TaxID=3155628 RepID=UPI0033CED608
MVDDWKRRIDELHENLVRRDDPAAWVTEADAVEASYRYPDLLVRGPVFGLATHDPGCPGEWRLLKPVISGTPQEARDSLNSHLWFRAKDETDDPRERRALLDAVAVLESEPVDELEVLGLRYRVVRADEFARRGAEGLEPPRPTDPEPLDRTWESQRNRTWTDEGQLVDPDREEGLMAGAMKLGLRTFCYSGGVFPVEMRRDATRAMETHPEVALLPVGFSVVELHDGTWTTRGVLMPSPHDARRVLFDGLNEFWPLIYRLKEEDREAYARAAQEFRAAGRANDARVGDSLFRVCRIERAIRYGPDGPEPPRPSDADHWGPMKLHPTMDDDGTLHHGED